jgi:guanylate kinase
MEKLVGKLAKGFIFVISAPAGTGKTTLMKMLLDEFPTIMESVSCTTRPPRPGEIDGKDYHFLKEELFQKKVADGEFLEHVKVFNHYYGTLRRHVEEGQEKGKHVVLVIDTQGAMELKKSGLAAKFIFISPPNLQELRARLFKRQTEHPELIEERLAWAAHELTLSRHYDYQFVNDNLARAYDILRSIFIAEEHKTREA